MVKHHGLRPGLTTSEPYRFNEDIDALLAKIPTAKLNQAAPYTGALVAGLGDEVGSLLMSRYGCGFFRA